MEQPIDIFNPVKYSLEECQFLIDHLGEPPVVALSNIPQTVIRRSVEPIIARVHELNQLQDYERKIRSNPDLSIWVGVEPMKAKLVVYLEQQAKWQADKKRYPRAPRFPSMSSYDGKNRPHRGGPGSDCGQVKTYFDKEGNRIPFALDLMDAGETGGWMPEWVNRTNAEVVKEVKAFPADVTKKVRDDVENHRLECPICNHTESYKVDSRSSWNAARGRISKHLIRDTKEVDLHRELYTNEFGE